MDLIGNVTAAIHRLMIFFEENKGSWFSGLGTIIVISFYTYFIKNPFVVLWNALLKRNKTIARHSKKILTEFNDPNFKDQLTTFVKYLKQKIFILNEDANWSSQHFTPLDAEVEVRKGRSKKKKVTNLLSAIKEDKKSTIFLILGDPGSGKSVALRKLCEDLLDEVNKTNKIPIYINLKEWLLLKKWSKKSPPTSNELQSFILQQLKGHNDLTDDFLENYFYRLLNKGYFFIILDSFDELPMVLDEDENSWLIDRLSEIIHETLITTKDSTGILSSRFFRKPSRKFNSDTTLVIRPFSNTKIQQTLKKSVNFKDELLFELFNRRTDLIPVARNPFSASLLSSFVQHNGYLPINQAALYENYIMNKLTIFQKHNTQSKISYTDILNMAKELAFYMFKSQELGLEIPLGQIKEKLSSLTIDVVDILKYAKIGRVGTGFDKKFSFIHRRFNEYFVAKKLLENPSLVPINSIPTDSRWRDALVLYCEVAPEEIAKNISQYCFANSVNEIPENDSRGKMTWLGKMHCLRFLADSFKTRKECLQEDDVEKLNEFIRESHNKNNNLLQYKFATEAIGLLPDEKIQECVQEALFYESSWITETAINSCRHISSLDGYLTETLLLNLYRKNELSFLNQYISLRFSFKLSSGFKDVYQYCFVRAISILMDLTGVILAFFCNPLIMCIYFFLALSLFDVKVKFLPEEEKDDSLASTFGNCSLFSKKFLLRLLIILVLYLSRNIPFLPYLLSYNKYSSIVSFLTILPCFDIFFFKLTKALGDSKTRKQLVLNLRSFFLDLIQIPNLTVIKSELSIVIINIEIWIKYNAKLLKRSLFRILNLILVIGSTSLLFFKFPSLIEPLIKPIIAITIAFVSLALAFFPLRYFVHYISDLRTLQKLNKVNKAEEWHRIVIENYYNDFKTSKCRYSFVKFLYDENINVVGQWKKLDSIPYIKGNFNERANTLIAQLEERWLGLNR